MKYQCILDDVPNYTAFLTVDELRASAHRLVETHPEHVKLMPIGKSRRGEPIEALVIGNGLHKALLFAMPHPNEPIGSMTLEYLSWRLAEDAALIEELGYTWYMVKCIDPDGTRLNEGWFKGPYTLEHYARNYYRPPAFQQIEWTFPVDYKTLHFHNPLPETRALMHLMEQVSPDLLYSLHNSGFGGVYFYVSGGNPHFYQELHDLVAGEELPLHLGEPEMPFIKPYAPAIFPEVSVQDIYDYYAANNPTDPAVIMRQGASSFDYLRGLCTGFSIVCEMPYFYNPKIVDTNPSDIIRRDAILQSVARDREYDAFHRRQFEAVADLLTAPSPFVETIQEWLRIFPESAAALENWARNDPQTARPGTVAEVFDSLVVGKFYRLFTLGLLLRAFTHQMAVGGEHPRLRRAYEEVEAEFERQSAEVTRELDYHVIPIRKLVRVQLGAGLLAAELAREMV